MFRKVWTSLDKDLKYFRQVWTGLVKVRQVWASLDNSKPI